MLGARSAVSNRQGRIMLRKVSSIGEEAKGSKLMSSFILVLLHEIHVG